jgi:hypothetical protein
MMRISSLPVLVVLCAGSAQAAAPTDSATVRDLVRTETLLLAPSATISNGEVSARIFLPDAQKGFYRGSRFDWAGVIGSLRYRGHDYYVPWFNAMSPAVRDFTFSDIGPIASANTAATGPVEEFNAEGGALGYAAALPGGRFVKIGVGVLQRPDATPYSSFMQYPIVDPGKRTKRVRRDSVALTQSVADAASGYGYRYTKTLSLVRGQPVLLIAHELRNTGKQPIATTVYDHNFLNIDGAGTKAGLELTAPFALVANSKLDPQLAEIAGNRFSYVGALAGDQRVSTQLTGFGQQAGDYDFHFVDRASGAGLRITGDQPLERLVLWSIHPVMAIEPFVRMTIAPGDTFRWSYRYSLEAADNSGRSP